MLFKGFEGPGKWDPRFPLLSETMRQAEAPRSEEEMIRPLGGPWDAASQSQQVSKVVTALFWGLERYQRLSGAVAIGLGLSYQIHIQGLELKRCVESSGTLSVLNSLCVRVCVCVCVLQAPQLSVLT